jgi:hypothetical protein
LIFPHACYMLLHCVTLIIFDKYDKL